MTVSNRALSTLAVAAAAWMSACDAVPGPPASSDAAPPSSPTPPSDVRLAAQRSGGVEHLSEVEKHVLELVQRERRRIGAARLRHEPTLARISRDHNADMLQRGFFSHVTPDGVDTIDRVGLLHRSLVGTAGENIWKGTGYRNTDPQTLAYTIVEGWMASPGHRENILRREFTHLGVGVSRNGQELRATQTFASVAAWIDPPVPLRLREGSSLRIAARPARGLPRPKLFDLWQSVRRFRAAGPLPVAGGSIDVPPGLYTVRLYFEKRPGSYTIYEGPRIKVE